MLRHSMSRNSMSRSSSSHTMHQDVVRAIASAGLVERGAFHVEATDAVPDVMEGQAARTLVLLGNAGPAMWQRFSATRAKQSMSLDQWSEDVISRLAEELGARAFFPFTKPYLPFQAWAQKAEACFPSPIGMSIHPTYGLWHAYRGALAFSETLDVPPTMDAESPCLTCEDQPCLSACPVHAFSNAGYDTVACADYLSQAETVDCISHGCRARRACPIGTDYIYEPAQARFHMEAFLRAHRSI